MDETAAKTWIEACAHGLQKHWSTVNPVQLEEVARELYENEKLRPLAPSDAVAIWLRPVLADDGA